MVNVEKRALCTFGKHILAFGECTVEFYFGIGEVELTHVVHAFEPLLLLFGNVVVRVVEVAQNLFVAGFQSFVFGFEAIEDVAHTKAHAGCFVAVSRTDALSCRTHLVLALGSFVSAVEHTMGRKNKMGALADVKALRKLVAGSFELVSLSHEKVGRNDAAVADDVYLSLVENARGNGTQHEFLTIEDDGVAGVGAACEASYYVVAGGEEVHHFALAFIAENDAKQGIYFSFSHDRNGNIWFVL